MWNRETLLPLKLRSIATVSALIGKGIVDGSLAYDLQSARNNGVAKSEMAEILTHIAFYAGWPNAWAASKMAKEAAMSLERQDELEHGLVELDRGRLGLVDQVEAKS